MKDYQKNITVNIPGSEVYLAITEHIADWWSNDLAGAAAQTGDSFNIAFNNTRKTFEIVEAIPNKQVIWKCVKAYIDMASLENKSEWVGTMLDFKFSGRGHYFNLFARGLKSKFSMLQCVRGRLGLFYQQLTKILGNR